MQSPVQFKGPILVAEDNSLNQRLIELLLTHLQVEFKIVKNGKECCEELLRNDYRLIFMDISMPIMDGYEATSIIRRSIPRHDQPYIIAITANDINQSICNKMGIDGFMSKPIDLKKLRYLFSTLPQRLRSHASN